MRCIINMHAKRNSCCEQDASENHDHDDNVRPAVAELWKD